MQGQNRFDELQFRQKCQKCEKDQNGRIGETALSSLLSDFNLEQPLPSIRKIISYFGIFAKRNVNKSIIHETEEENEDQTQNQKQADNQDLEIQTVSIEEAVSYARMLNNKIPFQVWKKTAEVLGLQSQVFKLSNKQYFPLKDPGHNARVNIVVGDELQSYKSRAHLRIQKKSSQKSNTIHKNQQVSVTIKFVTANSEQSKKFGQIWKGVYDLIMTILQQVPGGGDFIKTLEIITQEQEKHLLIKVKCNNPQINFFVGTIVHFFDKIFKTEIRFLLEIFFDFNFDFQKFVTETTGSMYDILTKNIRIRFNYKSSEFMTALKQLMIANNAFQGISYVSDDSQTLTLILAVSSHDCDINIRFNNPTYKDVEQESLQQLLMMMIKAREMIEEIGQSYPQFKSMIQNAIKNRIQVEAQIFSLFVNIDFYLQGLDHLVLDRSAMQEADMEKDKQLQ